MASEEQQQRERYRVLDGDYTPLDKDYVKRTRNLKMIPEAKYRKGGKHAYAEWAHVTGIFQTLLKLQLEDNTGANILDVGCGTGLLALASDAVLDETGHYVGIDVSRQDVDFCRQHYPAGRFEFIHLDTSNAFYSPEQTAQGHPWPLDDNSFDIATALSVWTHFNEDDAAFYLSELSRVLKPGASALVTFFVLDDTYRNSLLRRSAEISHYHGTAENRWVFDRPAYGSNRCFHPPWAQIPEEAIGVTPEGLSHLLDNAGLQLLHKYNGNWKETPGLYFQDVLILQKPL